MTDDERLQQIVVEDAGVLQVLKALDEGISRSFLMQYISRNQYQYESRDIYTDPDTPRDEAYLLQLRYPGIVFSHATALFHLGLLENEPDQLTVTVKAGGNPRSLKSAGVNVHTIRKDLYSLGIIATRTPQGHEIRLYDLERTICDILRNRNRMEPDQLYTVLRKYAMSHDRSIFRLDVYAKVFHVRSVTWWCMPIFCT